MYERLTIEDRVDLRLRIDRERRRLLRIKAAQPTMRAGQCLAVAKYGGRCQNTAVDGGYCYAHKREGSRDRPT